MKQLLSALLVLALCLSLAACRTAPAATEPSAAPTAAPTEPATEPETEPETEPDALTCATLLEQAFSSAFQADSLSYFSDELYVCALAGFAQETTQKYYGYGHGEDFLFSCKTNHLYNYQGEVTQQESTRSYFDGVYTIQDAAQERTTEGRPKFLERTIQSSLLQPGPQWDLLEDTEPEDLGDRWYMEFSYDAVFADSLEQVLCGNMGIDYSALKSLSLEKEMVPSGFYALVDKETGALLAYSEHLGFTYEVEGQSYEMYCDIYLTAEPGAPGAYREITQRDGPIPEPEEKAQPLFYHVTSPEGGELWLLGSIHVGDPRTSYLPQGIYDALDGAEALAVEVDLVEMEERMDEDEDYAQELQSHYYYDDGSAITDHVSQNTYDLGVAAMKRAGQYRFFLDQMQAAVWSSNLNSALQTGDGMYSDYGVDYRLLLRAHDKDLPVISLEDPAEHLAIGLGCSDRLQELLLLEAAQQDAEEYRASLREMYELWCQGSEQALTEYLTQEEQDETLDGEELPEGFTQEEIDEANEEYEAYLMGERNPEMLKKAIGFLEDGQRVFYCVGLAHILGEDGLVAGLRAAGYTVERVSW